VPKWKRCFDLAFIMLTSPLWLPLMVISVLYVKLVSSGPVFYRQERVGLGSKPFMIWKFRSMQVNADTTTHEGYTKSLIRGNSPMKKLDERGDSRIIPGGKLFRAMALDELPQLFNVLCGEMSLVGPRPCTPAEFELYEPWHKNRVNVLPGMTGQWQVNGKNNTSFTQMIHLDLEYGRTMSIWSDASIIARTVPTLVGQIYASRRRRALEKANRQSSQTA